MRLETPAEVRRSLLPVRTVFTSLNDAINWFGWGTMGAKFAVAAWKQHRARR